jgi:hypothetical protein
MATAVIGHFAVQVLQGGTMEVSTGDGHGNEIDAPEVFENPVLHHKGKFQEGANTIRHDE